MALTAIVWFRVAVRRLENNGGALAEGAGASRSGHFRRHHVRERSLTVSTAQQCPVGRVKRGPTTDDRPAPDTLRRRSRLPN